MSDDGNDIIVTDDTLGKEKLLGHAPEGGSEDDTKTNMIPFTRSAPKRPGPVPVQLPPFIKGDWIRFYNNQGVFTIGQVEYVQEKDGILHLFTDRGVVQAHAVVEHRRK